MKPVLIAAVLGALICSCLRASAQDDINFFKTFSDVAKKRSCYFIIEQFGNRPLLFSPIQNPERLGSRDINRLTLEPADQFYIGPSGVKGVFVVRDKRLKSLKVSLDRVIDHFSYSGALNYLPVALGKQVAGIRTIGLNYDDVVYFKKSLDMEPVDITADKRTVRDILGEAAQGGPYRILLVATYEKDATVTVDIE